MVNYPLVAMDGNGNFVVAWGEAPSRSADVFALSTCLTQILLGQPFAPKSRLELPAIPLEEYVRSLWPIYQLTQPVLDFLEESGILWKIRPKLWDAWFVRIAIKEIEDCLESSNERNEQRRRWENVAANVEPLNQFVVIAIIASLADLLLPRVTGRSRANEVVDGFDGNIWWQEPTNRTENQQWLAGLRYTDRDDVRAMTLSLSC